MTFISIVWAENKLKKILIQKGLNEEDLIILFIIQTIATMPNPIFKTGPQRLLVSSLLRYGSVNASSSFSFNPSETMAKSEFTDQGLNEQKKPDCKNNLV